MHPILISTYLSRYTCCLSYYLRIYLDEDCIPTHDQHSQVNESLYHQENDVPDCIWVWSGSRKLLWPLYSQHTATLHTLNVIHNMCYTNYKVVIGPCCSTKFKVNNRNKYDSSKIRIISHINKILNMRHNNTLIFSQGIHIIMLNSFKYVYCYNYSTDSKQFKLDCSSTTCYLCLSIKQFIMHLICWY